MRHNRRDIHRRTAMKALIGAGAAAAGMSEAAAAPSSPASKRVEALALVGDRYHPADYIFTALSRTLVRDLGLSIDFRIDPLDLDPKVLREYRLLILLHDGKVWPEGYGNPPRHGGFRYWMTQEQGRAIKKFVESGGGALFYHDCTYISPGNRDFRDVLGAVTLGHPRIRPFKVKITNSEHPITHGVKDFVVTDEQHFMRFEKDEKFVLAKSITEDGLTWREHGATAEAAWAFDYGKGRVCYLAPGHRLNNLWNPEYEKMQKNAVRWLLRQA